MLSDNNMLIDRIESLSPAVRWAAISGAIFAHCLLPNRRWYYRVGMLNLGIRVVRQPGEAPYPGPALWVCNHFSFVDLLVLKLFNPRLFVLVKQDLLDEVPAGWRREGFRIAWGRLPVLWYNRSGKDPTIRQRMRDALHRGRVLLVFAEGTTQRSGPPRRMYPGSLEIARDCGVPIQPVCLRYEPSIGLDKHDDGIASCTHMMRLRGKQCGVSFPPAWTAIPDDIEVVRASISTAYHQLGDLLQRTRPAAAAGSTATPRGAPAAP